MKRNIYSIILTAIVCLWACAPVPEQIVPYLQVETEMISSIGDGDQFNIVIKSNVDWTVSCDADWVVLEQTEGSGDAVVVGAVKRGVQESERNCSIIVKASSVDLSCEIQLSQGKFEPVVYHLSVADIIKTAAVLEDGTSTDMVEFSVVTAQVASDNAAGNGPEGYVIITDNGTDYIRLVTDQSYACGSNLSIEMSGAKATRISSGNIALSGATVTASEGTFTYSPVAIDPDAVASFENQFVIVEGTQCQESYIGKNWGGEVVMESTKDTALTFKVYVDSKAAFASASVPGNSGSVTGIVVNGRLQPRSAADIVLTGSRAGAVTPVKKWAPIPMFFKSSAANVADNFTLADGVASFTASTGYSVGGSITFGGGLTTAKFGSALFGSGYLNTYITTVNWVKDAFVQVQLPITQEISGDGEFYMQFTCAKPTTMPAFSFEWSLDGSTWNKMNAIYCYSACTKALAEATAEKNSFNIPSVSTYQQGTISGEFTLPEPVSSGNIYFKVTALGNCTSATQTLRMNGGCLLAMKTTDSDLSGASVLASENFESCRWGVNPVIGAPIHTYAVISSTNMPASFSSPTGWTASTSMVRKGCLLIAATTGANWLTSPALSTLTAPTDVTVTFKIAPFVQGAGVVEVITVGAKVSGSGTVVGEVTLDKPLDQDSYNWHTGTFKVSGANADTQISIGADDTTNQRFYIDDVVIKR